MYLLTKRPLDSVPWHESLRLNCRAQTKHHGKHAKLAFRRPNFGSDCKVPVHLAVCLQYISKAVRSSSDTPPQSIAEHVDCLTVNERIAMRLMPWHESNEEPWFLSLEIFASLAFRALARVE